MKDVEIIESRHNSFENMPLCFSNDFSFEIENQISFIESKIKFERNKNSSFSESKFSSLQVEIDEKVPVNLLRYKNNTFLHSNSLFNEKFTQNSKEKINKQNILKSVLNLIEKHLNKSHSELNIIRNTFEEDFLKKYKIEDEINSKKLKIIYDELKYFIEFFKEIIILYYRIPYYFECYSEIEPFFKNSFLNFTTCISK